MKIKTKRGTRRIRNQRVICKRFVVTDYTGCSYITAGVQYPVVRECDDVLILKDVVNGGANIRECKPQYFHLHSVGTWCYATI